MRASVNSKQKTNKPEVDSVVVVHPVEHDLRSAIPASRHVACHLVLRWPDMVIMILIIGCYDLLNIMDPILLGSSSLSKS